VFKKLTNNLTEKRPGMAAIGEAHPAGISVVIPTRGSPRLVADLLASLIVAGERIREACEVIVVDDSPDPEDLIMPGFARPIR
jgi:hypothetical protein